MIQSFLESWIQWLMLVILTQNNHEGHLEFMDYFHCTYCVSVCVCAMKSIFWGAVVVVEVMVVSNCDCVTNLMKVKMWDTNSRFVHIPNWVSMAYNVYVVQDIEWMETYYGNRLVTQRVICVCMFVRKVYLHRMHDIFTTR